MILNTRRNTSPYLATTRLGIFTITAVFVALMALYATPRLVLAQAAAPSVEAPQSPPSPPTAPTLELAPPAVPATTEVADTEPSEASTPSTPPVADVPPAAKYKPDDAPSEDMPAPRPHPPKPPKTPKHRDFAREPKSLEPAPAVDHLAVAPDFPRAQQRNDEGLSTEERLARLEKMVRSLMRRQNLDEMPPHAGGGAEEMEMVQSELKHIQEVAKHEAQLATEQAKRAVAQAKRETELATEQAKRAVAQAKREAELHARGIEQDERNGSPEELERDQNTLNGPELRRDSANKELEALQKEHARLDREMQRLNRQMERLQQDKERMAKPGTP